jgi:hypothetical protein
MIFFKNVGRSIFLYIDIHIQQKIKVPTDMIFKYSAPNLDD